MIAFAEFLRIVCGRDEAPYPWQSRLAERCANAEPPSVIAVPTGAGKTTTVDALVWALAHQADRPAAKRTVGVRIVWAIDRRILVDEVHEHAERLAKLLAKALHTPADPLCDLAKRLADLSGASGPPLVATRWRGGLQERPEQCGPLQPQIISSTVAQIGSRLLFRGYGVGERSLASEAGLAACDTTICLDEAHLSEPFRQTVAAIRNQREADERSLALPGLRAITLTATPASDAEDVLRLDDADRAALGQRFTGDKRATLVDPEMGGEDAGRTGLLAAATADYVRTGAATVACVVNTVRRARAVFDALVKELAEDADVALLIGPQRPADRELMLGRYRDKLFDGKPGEKPLVCVATQTFEVGLDADVAAMVTESASATALIQRLGRLNRRGLTCGRATIVRDEGRWLYADDEPAAWDWLQRLPAVDGAVDVSVSAIERSTPPQLQRISHAATLTPEIVELLAQTAPRPGGLREPDLDAFLRGAESTPAADVAVCWRSDLREDLVTEKADGYRRMLLKLVPPGPQELLTLSLTSARALLAARYPQGASPAAAARLALFEADVEGATHDARIPEPSHDEQQLPFLVLRRGVMRRGTFARKAPASEGGETAAVRPSELAPGDVLVLPIKAGGTDEHGLAPTQKGAAKDVAADLLGNSPAAPVRMTPGALGEDPASERWKAIAQVCTAAESDLVEEVTADARRGTLTSAFVAELQVMLPGHAGLQALFDSASAQGEPVATLRSVGRLDASGRPRLDDTDPRSDEDELEMAWVLLPVKSVNRDPAFGPDCSPPTIDAHARAVSAEVRAYTERLRLPAEPAAALVLAACAHDHGKADARTQRFYRRGVRTLAATPIAKSEFGTQDPRAAQEARRLAGLPDHQRHEIASVKVLADALASGTPAPDALDPDLALYAAGTHHGLGRPIPQVPEGGSPARPFRIDAAGVAGEAMGDGRDGWAEGTWMERFWRVNERYGTWGTAYLVALLVLSDRVVSSEGQ